MTRVTHALFALALALSVMGLLMVYNTTSAEVIDRHASVDMSYAFTKQLVHGALGVGVALFVMRMGSEWFLKYSLTFLMILSVCLLLVFVPYVGLKINGARRWINVLGFSFQPSEFVKIIMPIAFIRIMQLKEYQSDLIDFLKSLIPLAIPLFLILIEPDNGSVMILGVLMIVLFFLCRINWKYWVIPVASVMLVGGVLAMQLPYVRARLMVYANPEHDILGKGHQPFQAKIAAGSGGLLGRGMGKSLQKLSYLPEARSDYIAAIYAEEFGFVGIFVLILLYMGIALCGFLIAIRAPTKEQSLVAASLTFLVVFQAFVNLGVVSGLLPSKGTNLPMFSHGGTSLIANFMIMALLLDIGTNKEVVSA